MMEIMARTLCCAMLALPKETSDWGTRESHLQKEIFPMKGDKGANITMTYKAQAKEKESIKKMSSTVSRAAESIPVSWGGYWWPLPETSLTLLSHHLPHCFGRRQLCYFSHQKEKLLATGQKEMFYSGSPWDKNRWPWGSNCNAIH